MALEVMAWVATGDWWSSWKWLAIGPGVIVIAHHAAHSSPSLETSSLSRSLGKCPSLWVWGFLTRYLTLIILVRADFALTLTLCTPDGGEIVPYYYYLKIKEP